MKTYTVLYAEDVPHYGIRELPAADDALALERAKAIIKVRSSVPHAIAFANGNMIHLRGKVMVQAVLLDVRVSVVGNRKRRRSLVRVFDDVKSGVLHPGEVEFRARQQVRSCKRTSGGLIDH